MAFDHLDPAHRRYVSYIDKSREYYQAQGYQRAYRWAANVTAPFTPPTKPLSACTVGVVTTTSHHLDDGDDHSPSSSGPAPAKTTFAVPSDPPPSRMFTGDLFWHKEATTTDDVESFLPLRHLAALADAGRIAAVSDRYYGVPTEYSQRRTAADQEQIATWCAEDGVDVVLLIPL